MYRSPFHGKTQKQTKTKQQQQQQQQQTGKYEAQYTRLCCTVYPIIIHSFFFILFAVIL